MRRLPTSRCAGAVNQQRAEFSSKKVFVPPAALYHLACMDDDIAAIERAASIIRRNEDEDFPLHPVASRSRLSILVDRSARELDDNGDDKGDTRPDEQGDNVVMW